MTTHAVRVDELAEIRRLVASGEARRIREAAHIRGAELARHIKASQSAVSRWESGERLPTGEMAVRYLRVLRTLRAGGGG